MTDSKVSDSGCFHSVIRRLLCTGSVPTYPSDNITEPNKLKFDISKKDPKSRTNATAAEAQAQLPNVAASPGIVARLMGLNSLPVHTTDWASNRRVVNGPDAVSRSKSVNFAEYLLEFDFSTTDKAHHRRVRTSSSFREVPPLMNRRNDNLLVVYLNNAVEMGHSDEKKTEAMHGSEVVPKQRKEQRLGKIGIVKNTSEQNDMSVKGESMNRRSDERSKIAGKLKDEPRRNISIAQHSSNNSPKVCRKVKEAKELSFVLPACYQKKSSNIDYRNGGSSSHEVLSVKPIRRQKETISKKKKKIQNASKIEKLESGLESENPTPISVFHFSDAASRPTEINAKATSTTTKKLSYTNENGGRRRSTVQNECYFDLVEEKEADEQYCFSEVVDKLYRFTEEDLRKSDWMVIKNSGLVKFDDVEDICMELQQKIMSGILFEMLDELSVDTEPIWPCTVQNQISI